MTKRAVTVVRSRMWIRTQIFRLIRNSSFGMALNARILVRILRIVLVGTMTGLAVQAANGVAISTERFRL